MECQHHCIIEKGLALLDQSHMPLYFWSYYMSTTIYLISRLPIKSLNNLYTYEFQFHKIPYYTMIRTFGTQCFLCLSSCTNNSSQPISNDCAFHWLCFHHHVYLCLDYSSEMLYVSRHVTFHEFVFCFYQDYL